MRLPTVGQAPGLVAACLERAGDKSLHSLALQAPVPHRFFDEQRAHMILPAQRLPAVRALFGVANGSTNRPTALQPLTFSAVSNVPRISKQY